MLYKQSLIAVLGSRLALAGLVGARAPSGPFGLYAFGSGIGGAPVFYSHDVAYIGDQTHMDDEEAVRVVFTAGPNNTLFTNPDTTSPSSQSAQSSWENKAFFIPSWTSSSHHVGFTTTTDPQPEPDVDVSGFIFYGATAMHLGPGNDLHDLWYVVPTQFEKIWALRWNSTGDDENVNKISVTLRTTAPVQPFK
ncbi:hypothetical protein GGS20DRAFT_491968 [Poronia punctata]|nr:hypothetical protein GGS20DRAFT_491968 [Poronia punctata]